ncbi:hypothetical protein [Mycobacterium mantenii]|uniref:Uncharacterized protein n=1 Tax=Mycobacterium mantenii TaxID=560555 RepID=A0A1A2T9Q7_MYCNT|nr:hypothetical protein [Mycobacterium mantenii]OBH47303.1 hypothetical protein A5688_03095 [Mycobacterium mantenii]OBH73135.1 hypothetical protein A5683_25280 [Mycobacterium mantenii]
MRGQGAETIEKYLDKVLPGTSNRHTVEQRPPAIEAKQRRLPGKPRPADVVLAEYESRNRKRREHIKPPLWRFWAPDPSDVFRWRIELDCGCIEERLKNSYCAEGKVKPDSTIATSSDFDGLAQEWLPPGEFLCCGKHRKRLKPIRNVADWGYCEVREFPADPVEPPQMWADHPDIWAVIQHPEPHKSAFWKTLLDCGHFADVVTDVDWKPEDGPTHPTPERLKEMRAEMAELDRWHKHLLDAGWPRPAPFHECYMCSVVRRLVAYEPIDWVSPRPKPVKPMKPKPSRTALERRLQKLESDAAQLREQLRNLPIED